VIPSPEFSFSSFPSFRTVISIWAEIHN
jgi:hypothetical protein